MRRSKRDIGIGSRSDSRTQRFYLPTTEQDVPVLDDSRRMPDRPRGLNPRTRTTSPSSPPHLSSTMGSSTDLYNDDVQFLYESQEIHSSGSSSPGIFSSRRLAREFEPKSQPSSPNLYNTGFPRHRNEPQVVPSQVANISSLLELAGNTPSALLDRARETRRHGTQEAVRDRAKEISKDLGGCETPYTAYSVLKEMMEFAFGLVEFTTILERQQALDDFGAFRKMVDVQHSYLEHAGIQKLACTILGSLRIDESIGGVKLGMMQTVDAVVQCLREHGRIASICREGIRALTALSRMNDVRTRIIPTCNAIGVTAGCMELHAGDQDVQNEGARFFSHASLHSETNKSHIAMHGGLRRALRAAREFPTSRALHTHLCTTLRNITRHSSKPNVQVLALAVAGSVASAGTEHTRERLIQVGAVKAALSAMYRFVNRRGILLTGSRLVKVLLVGFEQALVDLRQCGGVERLLDILYCTVVTPTSGEERYSGYADALDNI
ncbi:unnamed protein product [Agarophyton chilense]